MTEKEIVKGIRMDAVNLIIKGMGNGTLESLSGNLKIPKEVIVDSLKELCKRGYLYGMPDENSIFPAVYRRTDKTESYLNNPF